MEVPKVGIQRRTAEQIVALPALERISERISEQSEGYQCN